MGTLAAIQMQVPRLPVKLNSNQSMSLDPGNTSTMTESTNFTSMSYNNLRCVVGHFFTESMAAIVSEKINTLDSTFYDTFHIEI